MANKHTRDTGFGRKDRRIKEDEDSDGARAEMLEDMRKQLEGLTVRNYDKKRFISFPSMREFWKNQRYPLDIFLAEMSCAIPSDKLELIRKKSLRIVTALALTEWDSAKAGLNFRATFQIIFVDKTNRQWNDELLLLRGPEDLLRLASTYLSPYEKNSLEDALFKVAVPVLEKSKERKPYSPSITLPITSSKSIGTGAYGEIYQVQIAPGCLCIENKALDRIEENKADEFFAWKKMYSFANGQTELDFARDYDKVTTRFSKFILEHLAIIEMDKEHASILYPLAQGSLQALLKGSLQCEEWSANDPQKFQKIIEKCYALSDGLECLHNGLQAEGEFFVRHGDLKPDNFLIFVKDWKIADMGLAKVKRKSYDDPSVRVTTKTSRTYGGAAYAAPEMKVEGAMVGRSTDVWALAAIMTEIIIWGFGGPEAWKKFEEERRACSEGYFHHNNALSKVVDDELASWPKKYVEAVTQCLRGDQDSQLSAQQLLDDLIVGLRKALTIEVEHRAKSRDLLDSFQKILKYFSDPRSVDVGMQSQKQLVDNEPSATKNLTVLLDRHLDHDIFRDHFQPREHICVSENTEWEIRNWITRPTPTAIAIDIDGENPRFQLSAITHEVYYTARLAGYKVVKFLTLERYGHRSHSLRPSLDLVYCFIQQFIGCWGVKEYDVGQLAMDEPAISDETKFKTAVALLGSLVQTHGQDRSAKPLIVIIDEFWRSCQIDASETAKDQWRLLLAILGCGEMQERDVTNAASRRQTPHLKVLIRVKRNHGSLRHLGFKGKIDHPPAPKPSGQDLRTLMKTWLRKYEESSMVSTA